MGFGSKAERNGKCKCESRKWNIFELRETYSHEAVVTVSCTHCKALWDTRAVNDDILSLMTENQVQWYKKVLENKIETEIRHFESINKQIIELQDEKDKIYTKINKMKDRIKDIYI